MSPVSTSQGKPELNRERKTEVKVVTSGIYDEAEPVAEMEVKPNEQPHMSLGTYSEAVPPKGFVVAINPDPESAESVVTQIMQVGSKKNYELVLHIANYSNQTVSAEVRRL